MMKIYFCGSIRGGRSDAELYRKLIAHLQQFGSVLTEHIGLPEPVIGSIEALNLKMGDERDKKIFENDMGWLRESDVVVAEVTQTSAGVGFELGVAWKMEKPVLALFRPSSGNNLSAMIGGAVGPKFQVERYEQIEEIIPVMDKFIKQYSSK